MVIHRFSKAFGTVMHRRRLYKLNIYNYLNSCWRVHKEAHVTVLSGLSMMTSRRKPFRTGGRAVNNGFVNLKRCAVLTSLIAKMSNGSEAMQAHAEGNARWTFIWPSQHKIWTPRARYWDHDVPTLREQQQENVTITKLVWDLRES